MKHPSPKRWVLFFIAFCYSCFVLNLNCTLASKRNTAIKPLTILHVNMMTKATDPHLYRILLHDESNATEFFLTHPCMDAQHSTHGTPFPNVLSC